jgi:deoxyadenosine/deoxycytidine kinase
MNPPAGMFVAVAGNIGVGKTLISRALGERLGWSVYYEPVIENPYLDRFYADMSRWAFHLQVYFLSERFKAQKRMLQDHAPFIQDRTIYEDAEVFATTLLRQGNMTRVDYDTYRSLFVEMVETLTPPDLIVYLRAGLPTLLDRIRTRGRECEQGISPEYLERLEQAYANWMAEARDRFDVIEVETDGVDTETLVAELVPEILARQRRKEGLTPHRARS